MKKPARNKKKIIIGVTGSFGSGKTTVSSFLKSFGAGVIDADKIAHQVISPGSSCRGRLVQLFGKDILSQGDRVDRKKLGKIVFENRKLVDRLNRLVHPEVIKIIKQNIKCAKNNILILDAPLLIESGLNKVVDYLIVVKVKKDEQFKRIEKRTALGKTEITKRIKSQMSLQDKVRLADFVIDNSGTLQNTKKQVREVWKSMGLNPSSSLRWTRD